MTLNSDWYDVEMYWLKWLKVFYCVRGLGLKSYVSQFCVIICYYFKYMLIMLWNNMTFGLYLLA